MNFEDLVSQALSVRATLHHDNWLHGRPAWTVESFTAGLVSDVGDLSRLVQARGGFRDEEDIESRLRHELCDCLWSVLVLADELGVDLARVFPEEMHALSAKIASQQEPRTVA